MAPNAESCVCVTTPGLGSVLYADEESGVRLGGPTTVVRVPGTLAVGGAAPDLNGLRANDVAFGVTADDALTVYVRGGDGVLRSTTLELRPIAVE